MFGGRLDELLRTDTATARALNDQAASNSRSRRTFDDTFCIENASSNNLRHLSGYRRPRAYVHHRPLVAEFIDTLRRRPAGRGQGGDVVASLQWGVRPGRRVRRRAFAAANQVSPALFSFN